MGLRQSSTSGAVVSEGGGRGKKGGNTTINDRGGQMLRFVSIGSPKTVHVAMVGGIMGKKGA